jgi:hypothetical protein
MGGDFVNAGTLTVQRDEFPVEALSSAKAYCQQRGQTAYLVVKGEHENRDVGVDAILYYRAYLRVAPGDGNERYDGTLVVGNVHEAVYQTGRLTLANLEFGDSASHSVVTGFASFLMDPPGELGSVGDVITIEIHDADLTKVTSLEPHFAKQVIELVPLLKDWWRELSGE